MPCAFCGIGISLRIDELEERSRKRRMPLGALASFSVTLLDGDAHGFRRIVKRLRARCPAYFHIPRFIPGAKSQGGAVFSNPHALARSKFDLGVALRIRGEFGNQSAAYAVFAMLEHAELCLLKRIKRSAFIARRDRDFRRALLKRKRDEVRERYMEPIDVAPFCGDLGNHVAGACSCNHAVCMA